MIDKFKTCKDCPDRTVGCHSTCEGYLERKRKRDEVAEKRRRVIAADTYEVDVREKNKWGAWKSHGKKNYHK